MSKRLRQYVGLFFAILIYFIIHEGAHLIYALILGVYKRINFMGLGIQIDIHAEKMTALELGTFCLAGSVATLVIGYIAVFLADRIGNMPSKVFKASMYYITIALLFIDPIYLSILYSFLGGGDMNGIVLLIPQIIARFIYFCIFVINIVVFFKIVLPKYKIAFEE